jgi:hypothetical protein
VSGSAAWRAAGGVAALASALGAAAADDARTANVIDALRRTGEVSCQPELPFFCANLHVSCAGKTPIPTFAFRLRASGAAGSIEAAPGNEDVRAPYDGARLEWDEEGAYVVLRPPAKSGYVKLLADGRYSFRHYAGHGGVMSIGRCR